MIILQLIFLFGYLFGKDAYICAYKITTELSRNFPSSKKYGDRPWDFWLTLSVESIDHDEGSSKAAKSNNHLPPRYEQRPAIPTRDNRFATPRRQLHHKHLLQRYSSGSGGYGGGDDAGYGSNFFTDPPYAIEAYPPGALPIGKPVTPEDDMKHRPYDELHPPKTEQQKAPATIAIRLYGKAYKEEQKEWQKVEEERDKKTTLLIPLLLAESTTQLPYTIANSEEHELDNEPKYPSSKLDMKRPCCPCCKENSTPLQGGNYVSPKGPRNRSPIVRPSNVQPPVFAKPLPPLPAEEANIALSPISGGYGTSFYPQNWPTAISGGYLPIDQYNPTMASYFVPVSSQILLNGYLIVILPEQCCFSQPPSCDLLITSALCCPALLPSCCPTGSLACAARRKREVNARDTKAHEGYGSSSACNPNCCDFSKCHAINELQHEIPSK